MTIKKSQELKQLQSRQAKLEVDVGALEQEAKLKQQEHSKALNQLQSVKRQIQELISADIIVTEHALLRYIERVMGVDIEAAKNQILTKDNIVLIENMGNGKYPVGGGLKAVVKNRTVVSIA